MLIDTQAGKRCYALGWSYGEICVHCGCCSSDPLKRTEARIEYEKWELEQHKNFDGWADDPELRAIQEENVVENIRFTERRLEALRAKLAKLKGGA